MCCVGVKGGGEATLLLAVISGQVHSRGSHLYRFRSPCITNNGDMRGASASPPSGCRCGASSSISILRFEVLSVFISSQAACRVSREPILQGPGDPPGAGGERRAAWGCGSGEQSCLLRGVKTACPSGSASAPPTCGFTSVPFLWPGGRRIPAASWGSVAAAGSCNTSLWCCWGSFQLLKSSSFQTAAWHVIWETPH